MAFEIIGEFVEHFGGDGEPVSANSVEAKDAPTMKASVLSSKTLKQIRC